MLVNSDESVEVWVLYIECDTIKMTSLSVARLDLELGGMNIMWP